MEEKLLNKKTNFRWQLCIPVLSEGGKSLLKQQKVFGDCCLAPNPPLSPLSCLSELVGRQGLSAGCRRG